MTIIIQEGNAEDGTQAATKVYEGVKRHMEEREVTMSLNEMIIKDKVRCYAQAKWMLSNTKEVYERHGLGFTGCADDSGVNVTDVSWRPKRMEDTAHNNRWKTH